MYKYLSVLILFSLNIYAQPPIIQWQKCFGGTFSERAKSIKQTSDGGFIIGGYSNSVNVDLSNNYGYWDFFILKTNSGGDLEWKISMGGSGDDLINSIIQATDGTYLAIGSTHSNNFDIPFNHGHNDYWVMKIAQNGTVIWKKKLGGTLNEYAFSVSEAEAGQFMIVGNSESNDSYVLNNHGLMDIWLVKIDIHGTILWQKTYGGSQNDFAMSIEKINNNSYIITGQSNSTDGDLTQNQGGFDGWVIKIDGSGTIVWQKSFGGTLDDYFTDITLCSDGGFIAVGETYSSDFDAVENHHLPTSFDKRDYFVVKMDSLGNKLWSRCYGGSQNEYAREVVEAFDGNYIIQGESYSPNGDGQPTNNHGSADCWLIKVNPINGDIIWERSYGGGGHDDGSALMMTFDNQLIIAGHVFSNDGDINPVNFRGGEDIWIAKLNFQDCPQNLTLTRDIINGNVEFKASDVIQMTTKIQDSNSIIQVKTNKSILLLPKFQTQAGATFSATIGNGCSN